MGTRNITRQAKETNYKLTTVTLEITYLRVKPRQYQKESLMF